ncbi:hypothetical protein V2J09_011022 [Rumex salicifolius]
MKKAMVTGLPDFEQSKSTYDACMKGKQHRQSFPKQDFEKLECTPNMDLILHPRRQLHCALKRLSKIQSVDKQWMLLYKPLRCKPLWELTELPKGAKKINSQRKYVVEVIAMFGMSDYNVVCNPMVPRQKLGKDEMRVKANATIYK